MAISEQVPALRFVLWLDQRLDEYDHVAHLNDPGPLERLAVDLGLSPDSGVRMLWRWRTQMRAGSVTVAGRCIKGDHFSGTFPRAAIEEALHAFGADFYDVYPQYAHELEAHAALYERWCSGCRDNVTTNGDGLCPWCETPTSRAYHGRRRGKPVGKHRKIPDDDLRMLHELYWREQLSVRQLAEQVWERYGYKSTSSASNGLFDGFRSLKLGLRDQAEVTRQRNYKHGHGARGRDEHEYRVFIKRLRGWNSLHGPGRPDCAATKTDGQRCTKHALQGSDYCVAHDPERKLAYEAQLAQMRATANANRELVPLEPLARVVDELYAERGRKLTALALGINVSTLDNLRKRRDSDRRPRTEMDRKRVERYLARLELSFEDVYGEQIAA